MKSCLIIPTYNEVDNIGKLVANIFSLNIENLELIIIDDNSPDGTARAVEKLIPKYRLNLIKREKKLGIGSAYILGFKEALKKGADLIFQMDADFSHQPKEIPNFIKAVNQGAEVVIGSRYTSGGRITNWGWLRKLMSRSAIWLSRFILRLKVKDVTSGYRCYRKEVLIKLDLNEIKSNGYSFQEEMLYRCQQQNFKIVELPIEFIDRSYGRSKLSLWEIINFFITLIRLKFKK